MNPMPFRLHVLLWLSGIILACLVTIPAQAPAQAAAADQLPEGPTKLLRFADILSFERHRPRLDSRRQEHPLPLRPLQRASEPLHEALPGLPARGPGEAPASSSREPD